MEKAQFNYALLQFNNAAVNYLLITQMTRLILTTFVLDIV